MKKYSIILALSMLTVSEYLPVGIVYLVHPFVTDKHV